MKANPRNLTLADLPEPPPDRVGWPWTKASESLPEYMPDGSEWPRISIVTPSYNQENFIEETIRSVLLQGYPNLEYIIIDGDSDDNSIDIIKRYEKLLDYWVSEPDKGQSHAINKGFKEATGDIFAWINSDDFYQPNAFEAVAKAISSCEYPCWLVAASKIVDETSKLLYIRNPDHISYSKALNWVANWFPQQSTFWHKDLWLSAGPLNESLHYAMDAELWFEFMKISDPKILSDTISAYRQQENAKCLSKGFLVVQEIDLVVIKQLSKLSKSDKRREIQNGDISDFSYTLASQYLVNKEFKKSQVHLARYIETYPKILFSFKTIKSIIKLFLFRFKHRFKISQK